MLNPDKRPMLGAAIVLGTFAVLGGGIAANNIGDFYRKASERRAAEEQSKRNEEQAWLTRVASDRLGEWGLTGEVTVTGGPEVVVQKNEDGSEILMINFTWLDPDGETSHFASLHPRATKIDVVKSEDPQAESTMEVDFEDLSGLGYNIALADTYEIMGEYREPEYPLEAFSSRVTFNLNPVDLQAFNDSLGAQPLQDPSVNS